MSHVDPCRSLYLSLTMIWDDFYDYWWLPHIIDIQIYYHVFVWVCEICANTWIRIQCWYTTLNQVSHMDTEQYFMIVYDTWVLHLVINDVLHVRKCRSVIIRLCPKSSNMRSSVIHWLDRITNQVTLDDVRIRQRWQSDACKYCKVYHYVQYNTMLIFTNWISEDCFCALSMSSVIASE